MLVIAWMIGKLLICATIVDMRGMCFMIFLRHQEFSLFCVNTERVVVSELKLWLGDYLCSEHQNFASLTACSISNPFPDYEKFSLA